MFTWKNPNDILNGLISSRLPKTVFIGKESIEMGVNSAIIHFNDGRKGGMMVLEHFGLKGEIQKLWR